MAHILVIDDDVTVRTLITDLLDIAGHTFDTAENGHLGIQQARKRSYDLLIVDRMMPVMDGIQTVAVLRSDPKLKNLTVLMCTSASTGQEVEEAFTAGANDYILKPINIKMLTEKIKKWTVGSK